jgi:hypothetical protein
MLKEAKLPSPEPIWVLVNRSVLPKNSAWPFGNNDKAICFGTKTIPLARTMRKSASIDHASELLKWNHFSAAATFDEAIANEDRNPQNILTDGRNYWLIDHSHAFANRYRTPGALNSESFSFTNELFKVLAQQSSDQRMKRVPEIKSACAATSEVLMKVPYALFPKSNLMQGELTKFFNDRSQSLVALCLARLNMPELGFS